MDWLRQKFGWLRDLVAASGARSYGGPDVDSPRYPTTPQLHVPEELKRAIDERDNE